MRIITGSAKGVKLKTPRGLKLRPTSDRVKETVFNILSDRVLDAKVLDLFAGTGNLGLEALSRGAFSATFVEQNQAGIALIKANALLTKLAERVIIRKDNVISAIAKLDGTYDLIFCDPPYNQDFVGQVISQIDKYCLLSDKGVLIVEHSQHEIFEPETKGLLMVRSEKFGDTYVGFWQKK